MNNCYCTDHDIGIVHDGDRCALRSAELKDKRIEELERRLKIMHQWMKSEPHTYEPSLQMDWDIFVKIHPETAGWFENDDVK